MKKSILTLSMVVVFFLIPMLLQAQEVSIMLGSFDFVPYQDDNDYWRNADGFYSESGAVYRYFSAPLHLPEGVRIKRVVLFFHDSGASGVQLRVYRNNKYSGAQDEVIGTHTSSGTPGDSTLTANANWTYNLVQNTGYSYSLRIHFTGSGSAYKFFGARVFYE